MCRLAAKDNKMYYVLLDINFTPHNTFDIRQMESPSLVVYWVSFLELTTRVKRCGLIVIDDAGNIVKSCYETANTTVTPYVLSLVRDISVSGNDWPKEIFSLGRFMPHIKEFYKSKALYRRKINSLPRYNNIVNTILR